MEQTILVNHFTNAINARTTGDRSFYLKELIKYFFSHNGSKYRLSSTTALVSRIYSEWGQPLTKSQASMYTRDILSEMGYDLAPKQGKKSNMDFLLTYTKG